MKEKSPFLSVDPAGPASSHSSVDKLRYFSLSVMNATSIYHVYCLDYLLVLSNIREVLLDEERRMYERYSALFALRNHGGEEAVSAIIDSLGAKSALLKHEV